MSSSLDRAPENGMLRALRSSTEAVKELRARQRLSGSGGQLGYLVETADEWDLQGALPTVAFNGFFTLQVDFTGDGTQQFPIGLPVFDLFINGTTEAHRYDFGLYPDALLMEDELKLRWAVEVQYQGAAYYYFKPRLHASCPGQLVSTRTT